MRQRFFLPCLPRLSFWMCQKSGHSVHPPWLQRAGDELNRGQDPGGRHRWTRSHGVDRAHSAHHDSHPGRSRGTALDCCRLMLLEIGFLSMGLHLVFKVGCVGFAGHAPRLHHTWIIFDRYVRRCRLSAVTAVLQPVWTFLRKYNMGFYAPFLNQAFFSSIPCFPPTSPRPAPLHWEPTRDRCEYPPNMVCIECCAISSCADRLASFCRCEEVGMTSTNRVHFICWRHF